MISNAFKGAYTNEVNQQNQGINTITGGVKDAIAGAAIGAYAAQGGLGKMASRLFGVGGGAVASLLQEKTESAKSNEETKRMFSGEEVGNTINAQLGDNPINRSAKKQLATVFETLSNSSLINKKGNIDSSFGDIDPNSELGKRILEEEKNDTNR